MNGSLTFVCQDGLEFCSWKLVFVFACITFIVRFLLLGCCPPLVKTFCMNVFWGPFAFARTDETALTHTVKANSTRSLAFFRLNSISSSSYSSITITVSAGGRMSLAKKWGFNVGLRWNYWRDFTTTTAPINLCFMCRIDGYYRCLRLLSYNIYTHCKTFNLKKKREGCCDWSAAISSSDSNFKHGVFDASQNTPSQKLEEFISRRYCDK